jgi:hypothetical protein
MRNAHNSPLPNFADVAKLIVPNGGPIWLPAHLEWWAQGVRHERMVDELRPSTLESRDRLADVVAAAKLIERELSSPAIRSLLSIANSSSRISVSSWNMRELASRAETASLSTLLTSADGKTKRGRSKPKIPDLFDARTLCASRILEMWRFFRKNVPALGDLEAAAAAQAYWLACGGQSNGWGNPLNGWFDYFKAVQESSGSPGLKQLIWWRDLLQAERRGGPPWFLGTYFPLDEPEIRSVVPVA